MINIHMVGWILGTPKEILTSVIMRADKNLMLDIFGHLCLHISARVFLEDPDEDDLKLVWFGDTRKEK